MHDPALFEIDSPEWAYGVGVFDLETTGIDV